MSISSFLRHFILLFLLFRHHLVYVHHLSFAEIKAVKLRAQLRAFATQQKKKEENKTGERASSSAPKFVGTGAHKRKNDGKDDHPPKKPFVGDKSLKKATPLKVGHRVGKGLMTSSGPVNQGPYCRLFTHKNYAIEMVGFIIRNKDVDPCTDQGTDELGVLYLFDLAGVHFYFCLHLYFLLV